MCVDDEASDESFEFEAKRKTDDSWHPCRASLSSSAGKCEILLDFGRHDEKDTILSKEEALERLRIRSIPLQNGQCSLIKEGNLVLCMNKSQFKNLYFDAKVEKTHSVRHSGRSICRCTFEIKWVSPKLNGKEVVPSTSIMRLCDNNISSHQAFADFFSSSKASDCVEVPSFLGTFEETTFESDLQEILERQVEDITSMVDGSDNFGDILFGIKQGKPYNKNDFRRTTRSQQKEKVEIEPNKDFDKHSLNPRPLNPLAACAALASALQVQLPDEPAFSTMQLRVEYQHNLSCQRVKQPGDRKIPVLGGEKNLHEIGSVTSSAAGTRDIDKSVCEETQTIRSFQDESVNSSSAKLGTHEKSNSAVVPRRLTRSAAKTQMPTVLEVEIESLTKKLTSPKSRTTRHSKAEDNTSILDESEKISRGTDTDCVDSSDNKPSWSKEIGDVTTPAKRESKKRTSISSSMDTKTVTSSVSSECEEGVISQDSKPLSAKKKKASLVAPMLRSSPRLRSLARNPA